MHKAHLPARVRDLYYIVFTLQTKSPARVREYHIVYTSIISYIRLDVLMHQAHLLAGVRVSYRVIQASIASLQYLLAFVLHRIYIVSYRAIQASVASHCVTRWALLTSRPTCPRVRDLFCIGFILQTESALFILYSSLLFILY